LIRGIKLWWHLRHVITRIKVINIWLVALYYLPVIFVRSQDCNIFVGMIVHITICIISIIVIVLIGYTLVIWIIIIELSIITSIIIEFIIAMNWHVVECHADICTGLWDRFRLFIFWVICPDVAFKLGRVKGYHQFIFRFIFIMIMIMIIWWIIVDTTWLILVLVFIVILWTVQVTCVQIWIATDVVDFECFIILIMEWVLFILKRVECLFIAHSAIVDIFMH